jgi:hypothetical protein
MPLSYLTTIAFLLPIYLATGKKGVVVVLVGTAVYVMFQKQWWNYMEGLRLYKD